MIFLPHWKCGSENNKNKSMFEIWAHLIQSRKHELSIRLDLRGMQSGERFYRSVLKLISNHYFSEMKPNNENWFHSNLSTLLL